MRQVLNVKVSAVDSALRKHIRGDTRPETAVPRPGRRPPPPT